jgi:chromate transporter
MNRLVEIGKVFFKIGCIGFGGPAAHLAMMQAEVVQKRNWMPEQEFLDMIGITNLIPGPNSTEMAMFTGKKHGGWGGLFVAGFAFILPAVIITSLLAVLYLKYGSLPAVEPFISGIKAAVIALILGAIIPLAKRVIGSLYTILLAAAVLLFALWGANEMILLFSAGFLGLLAFYLSQKKESVGFLPFLLFDNAFPFFQPKYGTLFLTFLKMGGLLYGSGYVLFAFFDAELVHRGWLTQQQLIDTIAAGQITPGPVFSSATFAGWLIAGFKGAALATAGIFLPSFVFVVLLTAFLSHIRKSAAMGAFLDAVNIASVALIAAVLIKMAGLTIVDWKTLLIAAGALVAVFYFKINNPLYIVAGGALAGYVLSFI